jgi:hypothetical protein
MATRTRKWKDRQYNGQNKKDKRTNKDLQNTAQNTNDWTIATPLQLRVNSGTPVGQAVLSSSVSDTRRVTAKRHDLKSCSTPLLFCYCLLLRGQFSYIHSVVWWGIVPEPTARVLYITRQLYRKTVLEGEDNNIFST